MYVMIRFLRRFREAVPQVVEDSCDAVVGCAEQHWPHLKLEGAAHVISVRMLTDKKRDGTHRTPVFCDKTSGRVSSSTRQSWSP